MPGRRGSRLFFELLGGVHEREVLLREFASLVEAGDRVLDIATGSGYLAEHLRARGAAVTCLDIDAEAVGRVSGRGLTGVAADAAFLPFGKESFDKVLSWSGVVHIPEWRSLVREAFRVCRPGGRVALLEPRGAYAVRAFRDFSLEHEVPGVEEVLGEFVRYSSPGVVEKGFAAVVEGIRLS